MWFDGFACGHSIFNNKLVKPLFQSIYLYDCNIERKKKSKFLIIIKRMQCQLFRTSLLITLLH